MNKRTVIEFRYPEEIDIINWMIQDWKETVRREHMKIVKKFTASATLVLFILNLVAVLVL